MSARWASNVVWLAIALLGGCRTFHVGGAGNCDAGQCSGFAILSPQSGATVGSTTPTVLFTIPSNVNVAEIGFEACTPVSGMPQAPPCLSQPVIQIPPSNIADLDGGAAGRRYSVSVPIGASGVVFVRVGHYVEMNIVENEASPWVELFLSQTPTGAMPNGDSVSWGSFPDYNGDGFMDLAVGVSGMDGNGGVVAYPSSNAGITGSTQLTALPGAADITSMSGAQFGHSLANADVNGDGSIDLIVGRPFGDGTGAVYWYQGGPNFFSMPPMPRNAVAGGTLMLDNAMLGASIASAGDFDGDGYTDVIAGAPSRSGMSGSAVIFFGGPDGLTTTDRSRYNVRGDNDASFGAAVAGLGDVNGDGYDDLAIATPNHLNNGMWSPFVHVFLGGPGRALTNDRWSVVVGTPTPMMGSPTGVSVCGTGDLDRNGNTDLAVGLPTTGQVIVYYGGGTGLSGGSMIAAPTGIVGFGAALGCGMDANGDGYPDFVVAGTDQSLTLVLGAVHGLTTVPLQLPMAAPGGNTMAVTLDADRNGDGFADPAFAGTIGGSRQVLLYNGSSMTGMPTPSVLQMPDPAYGSALAWALAPRADRFGALRRGRRPFARR